MTLEDLLAEREICRNLARFARAMDARNWGASWPGLPVDHWMWEH